MKRELFSEREKELVRRIEHEHDFFKYKELSKQRMEIYQDCNEIRFTECVYEYLIYAEDIPEEQLEALLKCQGNIFSCLHRVYLDNENTNVGTWEEVSDLLDLLIKEQKTCLNFQRKSRQR